MMNYMRPGLNKGGWGKSENECNVGLLTSVFKSFLVVFCSQNEDGLVEYFEAVLTETKKEPRKVIGWVTNDLVGHLKLQDMRVSQR